MLTHVQKLTCELSKTVENILKVRHLLSPHMVKTNAVLFHVSLQDVLQNSHITKEDSSYL